MSTQIPGTPPPSGAVPMTEEQLRKLIGDTAREAIAPAVAAAIEPLTKAQTSVAERMLELVRKPEPAGFDKTVLGKYPFGRKVRTLALGMLEGGPAKLGDPADCDWLSRKVGEKWSVSEADGAQKWLAHVKTTLSAGNATVAGAIVMPQDDPEWIELLRNNAVVRSIARTYPMPRGATSRRKQTAAATAYYQGENATATASNLSVGRVNLSYKKLVALTVVSNDLIRFSAGESDRIVQEDLLRVSALREDRAFLVGNPPIDSGSPQGIRYQTAAANIAASAGVTLANIQSDCTTMVASVQKNNVDVNPQTSYWIMSASTYWVILALTVTSGEWVFKDELSAGRLFGFPIRISTQLEVTNSFIGAASGLLFFVHGPSLEIHDSMQRTVEVFRGGAYYDNAAGVVASGISNDETVITCIAEHDFFQRYDIAAAVRTGYAT